MVTKDQITTLLSDIKKLDFRFPGKVLSEALGEDKSNVSKILNGKIEPSARFIEKFYNKFGDRLETSGKKVVKEVIQVEYDGFMEVDYLPIHAQAGYLNNLAQHEETELPTMLVPKEFEKGKYLVIEVYGDSMDDGTKRSVCEGDKLLVKELDRSMWSAGLYISKYLFVISHPDGVVVKRIIRHSVGEGIITVHSFNPMYKDYDIDLRDVHQLFYVKKIVERKPDF